MKGRGCNVLRQALRAILQLPETLPVRLLRLRNRYPPLFVVGAPRSGTTVVVQHIVNSLEFGYFPNLSKEHPRSCIFWGALAKVCYRFEPSYESRYGIIDGPMAPSDGWDIFHRWFPRYDHSQPVRSKQLYELRNIIRMFEIVFGAPFINKNNANGPRIGWLSGLFPDALFVSVRRDFTDTVLSVLESRRRHGIGNGEWWGAAPPQFYDRVFKNDVEQVTYQVWGLDKCIEGSMQTLPPNQAFKIDYETFCERPNELIEWIYESYKRLDVELQRRGSPAASFTRSHPALPDREALVREIAGIRARVEGEAVE